jgi:hypothetical protein
MTFNLKKSFLDPMSQMVLDVPYGYNPVAAQFLWNQVYRNDPNVATFADMVAKFRDPQELQAEYETYSTPENVADLPEKADQMEQMREQYDTVMQTNAGSVEPFNLKKADWGGGYAPDQMELRNEQEDEINQINQNSQGVPQPPFENLAQFILWLNGTPMAQALPLVGGNSGDHLKEAIEGYYTTSDETLKGDIASKVFQDQFFPLGKGTQVMATEKHVGQGDAIASVNEEIKKLAQDTVNKNKKKSFNLKKTAQHKSLDNAILWGPGQSRIDPFLHQPVSDWHIVERNKGFGLVVDDIWNIDYETIWRNNVMDKYSPPYKNKEGEWVGGYIQKRFEVDKNIPETSNYQLKPGQKRKPILPEYGNTESRLQAARAKGDIAGANDDSKPFNWKEASSKKAWGPSGDPYQQQSSPEYYNRIIQQATDFANKNGIDARTALESFLEGGKSIDLETQKWMLHQVQEGITPKGNMQVAPSTVASSKKKS